MKMVRRGEDPEEDPELRSLRLGFAEQVRAARKTAGLLQAELAGRLRVGEEIRAARIKAGLSQAELGERIGRSQKYVSLIETGSRRLPLEAMVMIMRALGLKVEIVTRPISPPSRE